MQWKNRVGNKLKIVDLRFKHRICWFPCSCAPFHCRLLVPSWESEEKLQRILCNCIEVCRSKTVEHAYMSNCLHWLCVCICNWRKGRSMHHGIHICIASTEYMSRSGYKYTQHKGLYQVYCIRKIISDGFIRRSISTLLKCSHHHHRYHHHHLQLVSYEIRKAAAVASNRSATAATMRVQSKITMDFCVRMGEN